MTQRIFDIENEKDYADLWDIFPTDTRKIELGKENNFYLYNGTSFTACISCDVIKINWHDKTVIIRPIQEATEQDIGKICYFWEEGEEDKDLGILVDIGNGDRPYRLDNRLADFAYSDELWYDHCRRLTKQEIEELC